MPVDPDHEIPTFDPRKDSGNDVKALVESTPGKNLMAYSCTMTLGNVARTLSEKSGKTVKYAKNTTADLEGFMPGGVGREMGEMMEYINMAELGYYGGPEAIKELHLIHPKDVSTPSTDFFSEFAC